MERAGHKIIPRYVIGLGSMGLAAYFLHESGWQTSTVFFASSFFLLICATDTFFTRIPNLLTLAMVLVGFIYNGLSDGPAGLLVSLLGLLVGLALLIIPWLLGGMGAGDVKALAALGALLGPGDIFQVFLYTSIIGGVFGLIHFVLSQSLKTRLAGAGAAIKGFLITRDIRCLLPSGRGEQCRFPYAAAIALGFFAFVRWGNLVKIV